MKDSWKRSVSKSVSYRTLGFAATGSIAFVFTGNFALSAGIALSDSVIKILLYLGHERLWEKTDFGRLK